MPGRYHEDNHDYYGYDDDRIEFADPGSNSALRAATPDNPRDKRCPTCGHPNRLTQRDLDLEYHCNSCANALERGCDIDYYEPTDEQMTRQDVQDEIDEIDALPEGECHPDTLERREQLVELLKTKT